jgi:hypothetical protein
MDDVLVFTRRTPGSVDNLLVAVNDREDNNNVQTRNVATNFPAGTRLHELTGNASDLAVDPNSLVPQILVVDANGRLADAGNPSSLYLKVPSNRANGVLHGRGYVIYGPAVPGGTLSVTNVDHVVPPDDASVPAFDRRLSPVDVIEADSFEIQLQTTIADPFDSNTDDRAIFRIDSGFSDDNGNAGVDYTTGIDAGFEDFLTLNAPRCGPGPNCGGGGTGTYHQLIDATALSEGYHYITVRAFRHRTAGDPLFREFRRVIYVDRMPPVVTLVSPTQTGDGDIASSTFAADVAVDDADVTGVHIFLDQHVSTDFVALAEAGQGEATQLDLLNYRRVFNGAIRGNHRIDVVAFDGTGTPSVTSFVGINATTPFFGGLGDLNNNFQVNGTDISLFVAHLNGSIVAFHPAADFNADGLNDLNDLEGFVTRLLQ